MYLIEIGPGTFYNPEDNKTYNLTLLHGNWELLSTDSYINTGISGTYNYKEALKKIEETFCESRIKEIKEILQKLKKEYEYFDGNDNRLFNAVKELIKKIDLYEFENIIKKQYGYEDISNNVINVILTEIFIKIKNM